VGKWVECSVDVAQGVSRLVACPVSWDDSCKNSDAVGHLRFGSANCLEWSMCAEVASGTFLSFGGVRLSWPADDRAVIGTRLPGQLP
jgi:hypothetical protein